MSKGLNNFITALIMMLAFVMVYFDPFYGADSFITDKLYTHFSGTDSRIVIIGVDEETLAEYGNFNLWSRKKMAELIEKLYEDPENAPAIVGLDFIFSESLNDETDKRLAEAAKLAQGDMVVGTNLVYRGRLEESEGGELYYNTEYIDYIEMPYEKLEKEVVSGFTNECIARDGYIRYAFNTVKLYDEAGNIYGAQDSFAYSLYKLYMKKTGKAVKQPKTNENNQFQFRYSGETGEFSKISLEAVLSGKVPASAFKDKIVLVGAYAPGFQDSYQPASDRGDSMYGVEIHANIIQAYLQGKTMVVAEKMRMAIITAILTFIIMILGRRFKLAVSLAGSFGLAILYLFLGIILAANGLVIPCLYIFIIICIADLYFLVDNYQRELKKQMWSFTEAMAAAIDERTPYNASHTRNVAKYCGMVVDYINKLHRRGKEKEHFSENRKEQLVMGALMHDIGKIAVPLRVMNKATRLDGREKEIEKRFEIIRLKARVQMLDGKRDKAWYDEIEQKTKQAWEMVEKVNSSGFVNEETQNELKDILEYTYEDEPFFMDKEKEDLSIIKGTLTDEERKIMESHVSITKRILSKVYFNKYFKNSPVYAGQHHECLNGKGYPDGLTADELSTESRIMAVCDICDALLATDRPYKKPLPFEKAFDIMKDMADNGNIDGKYVDYLYQCLKQKQSKKSQRDDN